jgi:hypothetical protein
MNAERTYAATQNAQGIHQPGESLRPVSDLVEYVRQYTRERPEVVALWCLGLGFALGWKMKIW